MYAVVSASMQENRESVRGFKPGPKAPPGVTRDEVARLTAERLNPRQIAALLDISTSAVYQHLKAIRGAA